MTILDDMNQIYERFYPTLYYTVSFHVPPGKVLRVKPFDIYPEVWHFHPWDFAVQGALLSITHRMVDFHAWEPSQADIERSVKQWFEERRMEPIAFRDEPPFQFRIRRPFR